MMIMTLSIPSQGTKISIAGQKEDTSTGFMVEKDATKNRGSSAPCVQLTRWFINVMNLS